MWFKQIQLFQLTESIGNQPKELEKNLELLAFRPCLPSMSSSMGWVPPIDEENAPLVQAINGYMMICLQIEEKILPATVIRQELAEKIKKIEAHEDRKVRAKEKLSLKDEIILTLLPRAFSKLTRLYGYIDTKQHCLILGTANAKKAEQFISMFKKSVSEHISSFEIKKLAPIITLWLKNQNYPNSFGIEKACVLQDPNQQNRVIRCQHQDLFANSIQSLIKDGCEVKQLGLSWQDHIHFVLSADDFSLRSIKYQEEILSQSRDLEAETRQQEFNANFFIMTETLAKLLVELRELFVITQNNKASLAALPEAVNL
jgi:recombination associated protein RdgC